MELAIGSEGLLVESSTPQIREDFHMLGSSKFFFFQVPAVVFQGIQREQSTFGKRRTWSEHGKIASYFLWLVKVAIDRFDEELESNKGGLVINPLPFSFDKSCFDRFNEDLESNEGRTSLYTLS
jgi:hypothetical protein